ncbi:MAG: hypothetical protein A2156_10815 [Deltaproteobacteria bacterium RBG_16_48_10]|nr:MAG: hypothetical protein A2156_10815 [Deltaproteobacteria bacterium RBG_16_48_10]
MFHRNNEGNPKEGKGRQVRGHRPKVKAPSVTISIDYSDSEVLFSAPPLSGPGIPDGFYRISKPPVGPPRVTVSLFLLRTLRFSKPKNLRFENQIETFPYSFQ